ncbi:MAG TPA: hypothetical protein VEX86_04280 [Longimicrobium sp.]|nr:hypothetical protein [Longimicrobium sp.]
MRNYFALAFVLSAAAAPLDAQSARPAHCGEGYEIVLPARSVAGSTESESNGRIASRMSMFANENTLVIVGRMTALEIADTTLATRRSMLQLGRVGMLGKAGESATFGEPRDFEDDDRVGVRIPVSLPPEKGRSFTYHGIAEMSVARRGSLDLWVVMVFDRRRGAAATAAGERVLDSFTLTDTAAGTTLGGSKDAEAGNKPGKAER